MDCLPVEFVSDTDRLPRPECCIGVITRFAALYPIHIGEHSWPLARGTGYRMTTLPNGVFTMSSDYIQHVILSPKITSHHAESANVKCLFGECLDHLGRDMQEEDGCDEGDGENDDNVGITVVTIKLVTVTGFHPFHSLRRCDSSATAIARANKALSALPFSRKRLEKHSHLQARFSRISV